MRAPGYNCAQIAETLLQACPQLQIITTSREPLGLAAETVWRVPPLSLPEPHQPLLGAPEQQIVLIETWGERTLSDLPVKDDSALTLLETGQLIPWQKEGNAVHISLPSDLDWETFPVLRLEITTET